MIFDNEKEAVFNFGKHKGKKVSDILETDSGYYTWMMNGDFPRHTKKKLEEIRNEVKLKKLASKFNTTV